MDGWVCILGVPGSPVAAAIARRLGERGVVAHALALDAPLRGDAVTVRPGTVLWQGRDPGRAAVVMVERPVFPWPQPQRIGELLRDGVPVPERVDAEREARSLLVSALFAVAEHAHVVNPPAAVHLAVSPAIALDRLAGRGLPVHPWRLDPAGEPSPGNPALRRDVAGRELWHEPLPPPPGEPALLLDPLPGGAFSLLVVGGGVAAGLGYSDGPSWSKDVSPAPLSADAVPTDVAELAVRACGTLGLGFAAVSVTAAPDEPRVLWVEGGPDLEAWHTRTSETVFEALADHLVSVAAGDEGVQG